MGLFTPVGSAQIPIKGMITSISGYTHIHIPQTGRHSTPQTTGVRPVNRRMDIDMAKFNLDPESEEPTQPHFLGTNVDFRHSMFKTPQLKEKDPWKKL